MPLYEYVCVCGRPIEERIVNCLSAVDDQRCKSCGHRMTRRPSSPAFTVKGYSEANGYTSGAK